MGSSDVLVEERSKMDEISPSEVAQSRPSANTRRNRPGTSAADWCKWPNEEFEEMETTLAVQQFIQQIIRETPNDVDTLLKAPEHQDEGVWKYEHLRQFCMDLNLITIRLQAECTAETCTQMTATEQWIFLCAAHKNPKECSAIDYTRHTLDGAACLLNSNRYFPSRVNIKESSVAKLGSVCRRIYRIFSHAYFHHRQIYDEFEKETSLCRRFTKFVTKYDLMTADTLIVPIPDEETTNSSAETDHLSDSTTISTTTIKTTVTSSPGASSSSSSSPPTSPPTAAAPTRTSTSPSPTASPVKSEESDA